MKGKEEKIEIYIFKWFEIFQYSNLILRPSINQVTNESSNFSPEQYLSCMP